ncbi:cytochrome P450 [Pseudonocardiaceae bacterium YIM PH 21723]|nr:cytochrome P450 [Pseudonocardiaceae bacterium YIM PH 21723]
MSAPVAPGRWPLIGHTPSMIRQRFAFTERLRDQGDVVQVYLGPMRTYFVASPELTYRVLVTDAPKFRKGLLFDKMRDFVGDGLAMVNGAEHLRQRRLMQPAFSKQKITEYARTMAGAADELIASWEPGEVRQVDQDMQSLATTIVSRALFSTEISQADIDAIRESLFVVIKELMVRLLAPGFVEKLPLGPMKRFDAANARLRETVMRLITGYREHGLDRGDQLSMLLFAEDEDTGERMTDKQVYDEVLTLLTGGIETSALALSWLFHELARNPEVEGRLLEEIDSVLDGRPVSAQDVPKLTYTHQVVNEVLRKYPLWILMRRALEDVELGGTTIPAGSEVIFSPHAMHHNPEVFPDPEKFDPDRWSPERAKSVPRGAFIPFGAGARQCLGNVFAETEIVITVATVLSQWRLVPVPDQPVRVVYTSAAYPSRLPMTAIPRKSL